jgi:hypothetical protein
LKNPSTPSARAPVSHMKVKNILNSEIKPHIQNIEPTISITHFTLVL